MMAIKVIIGLLLAALSWVVVDTIHERIVEIGDKAPDFTVTTDNGRNITRANFGGKVLVLNFWATWCPPCIDELPSLNEFQRSLADSGVVVLGVSVDKNERTYKEFLKRARVAFMTARDPEAAISASYGTFKYPETYIIDSRGEVVEKFIGPKDWSDSALLERVKRLL
jgi:peroxiredoxin